MFALARGATIAVLLGAAAPAVDWDEDSYPDTREILNPTPAMMQAMAQQLAMAQQAAMRGPVAAPGGRPVPGVQLASMSPPPQYVPRPIGRHFVQARPQPQPPAPAPARPAQPAQAAPAPGPQSQGQSNGGRPPAVPGTTEWHSQCPPNQTTGCEISRRVTRPDGQVLATFAVAPDARAPGAVQGMLILPLGIAVRESVPFLIDERFVALLPIETCVATGCVMRLQMSPPMVAALRAATSIKLLALTPQGQTVPLSIPIDGFGKAYEHVAG